MSKQRSHIAADLDQPILFRTTNAANADAALASGSIWLRSDAYYRQIEDQCRSDDCEGVKFAKVTIPLRVHVPNGPNIEIRGPGSIGQEIVPHYILSLHGSSISKVQLDAFGPKTFGIRNVAKLSAEILYRASLTLDCSGYRYGPVSYRSATLALSQISVGASAIQLRSAPPLYLNPLATDVLVKRPVAPFIEQDEWRIVIFTRKYLSNDVNAPLKLEVEPVHFYPYDCN